MTSRPIQLKTLSAATGDLPWCYDPVSDRIAIDLSDYSPDTQVPLNLYIGSIAEDTKVTLRKPTWSHYFALVLMALTAGMPVTVVAAMAGLQHKPLTWVTWMVFGLAASMWLAVAASHASLLHNFHKRTVTLEVIEKLRGY